MRKIKWWRVTINGVLAVLFLQTVGIEPFSLVWWVGVVTINAVLSLLGSIEDDNKND